MIHACGHTIRDSVHMMLRGCTAAVCDLRRTCSDLDCWMRRHERSEVVHIVASRQYGPHVISSSQVCLYDIYVRASLMLQVQDPELV